MKLEMATDEERLENHSWPFIIADEDGNVFENQHQHSVIASKEHEAITIAEYYSVPLPDVKCGFQFWQWPDKWFVWKVIQTYVPGDIKKSGSSMQIIGKPSLKLGDLKLFQKLSRCSEIVEAYWKNPSIKRRYGNEFFTAHRLATSSPEPHYAIGRLTNDWGLSASQLDEIYAMTKMCEIRVRGESCVTFAFKTVEDAGMFKLSYNGDLAFEMIELENL